MEKKFTPCGQCGKPAITALNDVPVCIDCEFRFQQSRYMVFAQAATMMNQAEQEMEMLTGMPGNRITIPPAPIPPIHYNNQNVSVSDSTVGSINLGVANDIQTDLKITNELGEAALANAFAELTNAILSANVSDARQQNELIEQLSELLKQANLPAESRKTGAVKALFSAIKDGAATVGGIATAWEALEPLLRAHFGL